MMEHLSQGQMRSYLDGELEEQEQAECKNHLAACPICRHRLEEIRIQVSFTLEQLDRLEPAPAFLPPTPAAARARLKVRLQTQKKENRNMLQKIFGRHYRWGLTGGLATILMILALTVPSVGTMASNFLGLFRIEQVKVVSVNPANLPDNMTISSANLEKLFDEDMKVEKTGEPSEAANVDEASTLAGYPVRIPEKMEEGFKITVQPEIKSTYKINLERLKAILQDLGQSDIELPQELDGADIVMQFPTTVSMFSSDCKKKATSADEGENQGKSEEEQIKVAVETYKENEGKKSGVKFDEKCTAFIQMPSPTLTAPDGLDTAQLGKVYLSLVGMSPEEIEEFNQSIDWKTTLVVPLPLDRKSQSEVEVDGVKGTLIETAPEHGGSGYMLIWAKNGYVYSLVGPGDGQEGLDLAASLN